MRIRVREHEACATDFITRTVCRTIVHHGHNNGTKCITREREREREREKESEKERVRKRE